MRLVVTLDGSHTLFNPGLNQHYHSTHGAVQESQHIFIETGLRHAFEKFAPLTRTTTGHLSVLEIGFGTGLNALLTQMVAEQRMIPVDYTAVEAYPLDEHLWRSLNYPSLYGSDDHLSGFSKLHLSEWEKTEVLSTHFSLHKCKTLLESYAPARNAFHLIYFDAFGPEAQPELWTEIVFQNLFMALVQGGFLVTYSVKGTVVRALRSAGFRVEKLPGPPGKRHITRAMKT